MRNVDIHDMLEEERGLRIARGQMRSWLEQEKGDTRSRIINTLAEGLISLSDDGDIWLPVDGGKPLGECFTWDSESIQVELIREPGRGAVLSDGLPVAPGKRYVVVITTTKPVLLESPRIVFIGTLNDDKLSGDRESFTNIDGALRHMVKMIAAHEIDSVKEAVKEGYPETKDPVVAAEQHIERIKMFTDSIFNLTDLYTPKDAENDWGVVGDLAHTEEMLSDVFDFLSGEDE